MLFRVELRRRHATLFKHPPGGIRIEGCTKTDELFPARQLHHLGVEGGILRLPVHVVFIGREEVCTHPPPPPQGPPHSNSLEEVAAGGGGGAHMR